MILLTKKLLNKHRDIGIIKMEVIRNVRPKNNSLKVQKLAKDRKLF